MIIAFTGHRPKSLPGEYSRATEFAMLLTASQCMKHYKPNRIITGMALGWDQTVAQAAVNHRVPFIAAVPFEGQEKAWPVPSRARYRGLLRLADEVAITCAEPGFKAWKMHHRNRWMVDKADLVIGLFNGEQKGGTWDCMKYAQDQGKQVLNCWSHFMKEYERQLQEEQDHR